jgi:hypothetical protein
MLSTKKGSCTKSKSATSNPYPKGTAEPAEAFIQRILNFAGFFFIQYHLKLLEPHETLTYYNQSTTVSKFVDVRLCFYILPIPTSVTCEIYTKISIFGGNRITNVTISKNDANNFGATIKGYMSEAAGSL